MSYFDFEDKLEKTDTLQSTLEFSAVLIGILGLLGYAKLLEIEIANDFTRYCIGFVYLTTWAGMLLSAIVGAISASKSWHLMVNTGSISAASTVPSWDEMAYYSLAIGVLLITFWVVMPGFTMRSHAMENYVQGQFELLAMLLFGFVCSVLCYIAGGMRRNKRLAKTYVTSSQ